MTGMAMDLDNLECHFKWHPVDIDVNADLHSLILKTTDELDEYEDLKPFSLNLIGYLHTRVTPPDYNKALEYFDAVVVTDSDIDKGHKYITTLNKIHTLNHIENKQEEMNTLWKSFVEFGKLPQTSEAVVHGHRGYTFSYFGRTNYVASTEAYKIAMELDPQNYIWPWGIAYVDGRIRRIEKGPQSRANVSEEENLKKSIELSNEKKALPIIALAELLFSNATYNENRSIQRLCRDPVLMEESGQWFDKAYKLAPNSPEMLMRCGKFFCMTDDEEKGIAMLIQACEMNPNSPQPWFRLSQAYRCSKQPNLSKAEEYCRKAVTCGHKRHFYAEIVLGHILKKRNSTYDLIKHLEEMRIHYVQDDPRQRILDKEIQKVKNTQPGPQQFRKPPSTFSFK